MCHPQSKLQSKGLSQRVATSITRSGRSLWKSGQEDHKNKRNSVAQEILS